MIDFDTYSAFYFGFQKNGVPFSALWLKYGNYDGDPDLILELTNRAQSICEPSPSLRRN